MKSIPIDRDKLLVFLREHATWLANMALNSIDLDTSARYTARARTVHQILVEIGSGKFDEEKPSAE